MLSINLSMTKIRVTKFYDFEMAHALWNYDGLCKNIHGHTYKLYVTVMGVPCNDSDDQKNGMVIDFGDLKRIVKLYETTSSSAEWDSSDN
jgi:6-pyruvoyltetrahydropterin/6-carboxytetrahydropterin synthase